MKKKAFRKSRESRRSEKAEKIVKMMIEIQKDPIAMRQIRKIAHAR